MAKLKNTYEQSCEYCHKDFVPNKRGTQRFCSPSCRTTNCKKKRAGTLGRLTKLQGPGRGVQPRSFAETALASATGALAANTVSQTAEYFAVTKGLVQQVEQLTRLVHKLAADQARDATMLGRGTLTLLTKLGASRAEALAAINTPFSTAASDAVPQALPMRKEIAFPSLLSSAPNVEMPLLDLSTNEPIFEMPALILE